ncbi:hypothetical protein GOODEAATRI_017750 [Goodea atripinnis]|uniref:Uncharacterized protein n=1 Tax=Goodea atripinnis TaxID=208336 RepID=A0ABV0P5R2_9TELE
MKSKCENKETFIQQIQSLDIETQAAIAICIQQAKRDELLFLFLMLQVTQDPRVVLPLQWEELVEAEGADLQLVFSSMVSRSDLFGIALRDARIAELCQEREAHGDSTTAPLGGRNDDPPQSLALQLADSKAKLRRLKQQLRVCGVLFCILCVPPEPFSAERNEGYAHSAGRAGLRPGASCTDRAAPG